MIATYDKMAHIGPHNVQRFTPDSLLQLQANLFISLLFVKLNIKVTKV